MKYYSPFDAECWEDFVKSIQYNLWLDQEEFSLGEEIWGSDCWSI